MRNTTASPQQAVLGAVERDDVDAGIDRGRPQRRAASPTGSSRGVGDPGAVHVHEHPHRVGGRRSGRHLLDRVQRAEPVLWVIDRIAGCAWCTSPWRWARAVRVDPGVTLPSAAGRSISLAPTIRSAAPVSSTAMCARSLQTTAPAGERRRGQGPGDVGAGARSTSGTSSGVGAEQLAEAAGARRRSRVVAVGASVAVVGGRRSPRPPRGGRRRCCRWRSRAARGVGQRHRHSLRRGARTSRSCCPGAACGPAWGHAFAAYLVRCCPASSGQCRERSEPLAALRAAPWPATSGRPGAARQQTSHQTR